MNLKYFLCRKGDDEFLILLPLDSNSYQEKITILFDLLKNLCKKNYTLTIPEKDQTINVNYSYHAGISIFPEDIDASIKELNNPNLIIETLIKKAESALFNAKKDNEFTYEFYQKQLQEKMKNFLFVKQNIYNAIEKKEFQMYYQPYFSLNERSIYGAEALIRWFHQGEMISPAKFIPYLEETGQLIEVENIIFDLVFVFYKKLQQNNKLISISINLSPATLYKSNFINKIKQKIKNYEIDPSYLVFEITESTLIKDYNQVIEIIKELNKLNIHFALDDFGSGYSSLAYIEKLPISILKIDRQLIKELSINDKKIIIIEAIIQLAKKLNFKVVAEGIEKEIELDFLKQLQCDYAQGFLLGKPMPETELFKILKESTP
ncbi:MAG: hypothetical protein KatS3mg129_0648 [Leptospiraceae bacterium]|nr:MAG: hypothetical protein KatS3mg129_0648 [Leptospiraceae bacterium]